MTNQLSISSILKLTLLALISLTFLSVNPLVLNSYSQSLSESNNLGIIYSNPRVYNVDYSFEMTPGPNNIDRSKDLKVWIPILASMNPIRARFPYFL